MPYRNMPIIVGIGEVCEQVPADLKTARSTVELMAFAAGQALDDTGKKDLLTKNIDAVAAVRTFADSTPRYENAVEKVKNMPRAVAGRVNINPAYARYEISGGQSPQKLVSDFSGRLARGEFKAVLVFGGEALATVKAADRKKITLDWDDHTDGQVDGPRMDGVGYFDHAGVGK